MNLIKNRKCGFTLIELLAVIVILALITSIAVPIMLNIIEDSKKNSFIQTANEIKKAADLYYYNKSLQGDMLKEKNNFVLPKDADKLKVKVAAFESGEITIKPTGYIGFAIKNDKYCIKKRFDSDELEISENIEDCEMPSILESKNSCIDMLEKCPNGTIVSVKVNKKEIYDFYVINDDNTQITLLMSEPVGDALNWINKDGYESKGGIDYNSWTNHTQFGPITALNYLKLNTDEWTYILEKEYTISDENSTKLYKDIVMLMRARLLTRSEAVELGCTNSTIGCPEYLRPTKTQGYWLSNAAGPNHAYCINGSNKIESVYHDHWKYVVPVITLPKNS